MPKSSRSSLSRRPPTLRPKARLLLVCEGQETEPGYFRQLAARHRVLIDVPPHQGSDPKTVVETAVCLKKDADRAARKDPFAAYEEVWCVIDVDQHPRLGDALQQARDNGICVALSNPCIELWLLLHFQEQCGAPNCQDQKRSWIS